MRFAHRIGLTSVCWLAFTVQRLLADEPAGERILPDVTTARVAAQVERYLASAAAKKPARVEEYEVLRGLLVLDAKGLSVVDGHLRWICRPAYPLRPAQKSAALDSLEALLVRCLSEAAGTSPPLATAQQARDWVADSEIGLGLPPALRTPLTLRPEEVQLALSQQLSAIRAQQRKQPTAEFQQLSRVANLDAKFLDDGNFGGGMDMGQQFSLWYSASEILWTIPARDAKGYQRQWNQTAQRASPNGEDYEKQAKATREFEKRYFANVREPLASIVRQALVRPLTEFGGPLLSAEDAQSIRITISGPSMAAGAGPPGSEVLRIAASKGAVDRTISALTRSVAQEIAVPADTSEINFDNNFPSEEYEKIVVDAGGFQGAVVSALAFSPDGRWLAAAGDVVRIWDLDSGKPVHTLRWMLPAGGASGATSLTFSPDGRRLLVSVSNLKTTLHIYDTGELDRLHDQLAPGHDGHVDKLALSADGRWLVTAGIDQVVHVWDWPQRRKVRSYRFQQPLDYLGFPTGKGPAAAINVKGAYAEIATGPAKTGPAQTGAARGAELDRIIAKIVWPDHGVPHPFALNFLLDRGLVAAGGRSRPAEKGSDRYWCGVWQVDAAGRDPARQLALHDHRYFVTASALSGDGRWAASADGLGEVHVWSTADGQIRQQFVSRVQPLYAVGLLPQGKSYQIALGRSPYVGDNWRLNHYGPITHRFDLATRTLAAIPPEEPPSPRLELDGWQVTLRADANPRLLEVRRNGKLQSSLPFAGVERWWPLCYGLLADPAAGAPGVILGSEDGSLDLLEAAQLLGRRHFVGHADRVWAVDASPDGHLLVSGAGDGLACVWNLANPKSCGNLAAYVESSGRIFYVVPGTPTARAGLRTGDRVLAIDGRPIAELAQDWIRHQWPYAADARVQVEIDRQGKRSNLDVTLSNMGDVVRPLVSLLVDAEGQNWAVWTSEGYYDASPGGDAWIGWLRNRAADAGADFVACDQLRDKLYRPDVIDLVLETQDVGRAVAQADERRGKHAPPTDKVGSLPAPPQVKIVSPADELRTPAGTVSVEALVTVGHALPVVESTATAGGAAPVTPPAAPQGAPGEQKPEVRVLVNGAPIEVRDVEPVTEPAAGAAGGPAMDNGEKTYRARVQVPLSRGLTDIAVVSSADGASSSAQDAMVTVAGRGRDRRQPRLWVLAVGVSAAIESEKFNLQYADRDAEAFQQVCLAHAARSVSTAGRDQTVLDERCRHRSEAAVGRTAVAGRQRLAGRHSHRVSRRSWDVRRTR